MGHSGGHIKHTKFMTSYDHTRKKKMKGSKTGQKNRKKNPLLSIFPSRYSFFGAPFFKLSLLGGYFHSGGHIKHTKFLTSYDHTRKKKKDERIKNRTKKYIKNRLWSIFPSRYSVFGAPF